ncbi:hypothetical protein EIP91_003239 [Steccherinum ochraceum]|uniref:Transcription elongation factor Eaf N-terminal domain-containing protein n=1 Tax=Steccherinum ochraceum TaxID=92696 RepID=A0A4R0S0H3_9APHY|nr:hypothetical protein EIP91_003239 [Steccherinum ochraceum]
MTSVDVSMALPTSGTYDVAVGQSLSRALKARKGETVRSKVERELYSFRYNVRPDGVDTSANGTISVKKGDDSNTKVTIERASSTDGGSYSWSGSAPAAKEFDCVLIFDPNSMTFTMEKVDTLVGVTFNGRSAHGLRKAASPLPPSSAASSRPSTSSSSSQALSRTRPGRPPVEDEGHDEDAEGEIDEDLLNLLPQPTKSLPAAKKSSEKEKVSSTTTKGRQSAAIIRKSGASAMSSSILAPVPSRPSEDSEPEEPLVKQVRPQAAAPAGKAKAPTKAPKQQKSAAMRKAEKAALAFRPFAKHPRQPIPQPTPAFKTAVVSSGIVPSASAPSTSTKRDRDTMEQPVADAPVPAPPRPQPRPKRPKITPQAAPKPEKPKEPLDLALPTGSAFNLPSSVSAPAVPTAASSSSSTVPAKHVADEPAADSEDEDWEPVQPSESAPAVSTSQSQAPIRSIQMEDVIPEPSPRAESPVHIEGSDGVVVGEDDFLQDMFDEEEADPEAAEDDFLQDAFGEAPEAPADLAPVKSMNDLAQEEFGDLGMGGDTLWGDDDDDTSDDSSDDE